MQEEIWKDVVGYEEYFRVSESGRIFSKRTNKILKLTRSKDKGYLQFSTRFGGRKGKAKMFKVHVLVCEAFNGPRPNEIQKYALHWDDDKENNHYTNLRWGSLSENSKDCVRNGISRAPENALRGEANPLSKLLEKNIFEIIGNFSELTLDSRRKRILYYANKFDVSYSTIRKIVDGKSWTDLTKGVRLT